MASNNATYSYTLINNGAAYSVKCTNPTDCTCAIIPSEYNGKPVIKIDNSAFSTNSVGAITRLTEVVIPDSIISIGYKAFYSQNRLTTISIPNSVQSIGNAAFSNSEKLKYTVENNLQYLGNSENPYLYLVSAISKDITTTNINANCRFIGYGAFSGCSNLTTISIPQNVLEIGNAAFSNCHSSLYTVEDGCEYIKANNNPYFIIHSIVDKNVNTYNINQQTFYLSQKISYMADAGLFYDCPNLTEITIPDNIKHLNPCTFKSCQNLRTVMLPNSITHIGFDAFKNNSNLKQLFLKGKPPFLDNTSFENVPTDTLKIYCFKEHLDAYKTATDWSTYANNFLGDDLRVYFAINSKAQKDYFANKKYVNDRINEKVKPLYEHTITFTDYFEESLDFWGYNYLSVQVLSTKTAEELNGLSEGEFLELLTYKSCYYTDWEGTILFGNITNIYKDGENSFSISVLMGGLDFVDFYFNEGYSISATKEI